MESLIPVPENLLSALAKEQKQMEIRLEAGRRLDLHTKALEELDVGDCVQLQILRGKHPLKSDQSGVVTSKNGFSNYSVKLFGSGLVTQRNRASLRKVDPRRVPSGQTENLLLRQAKSQSPCVTGNTPSQMSSWRRLH